MTRILVHTLFFGLMLLHGCTSSDEKQQEATVRSHSGEIRYSAPAGWISETPSSSMRKAQFRLPGQGGSGDAEMAVFNFPGTGGSVDANLERWYGQFKQPDGSSTGERAEKEKINVKGLEVTLVYTTGSFLKSTSPMMMGGPVEELPGYAMLAAIVEVPGGPWFFKATGPEPTLDYWRNSFDSFVKTFKYN